MRRAMRLSPKEFIKGKKCICPLTARCIWTGCWRKTKRCTAAGTKNFRDLVKGFKTIKDSDFKEPESLSGVMRVYQKNGYQWMRTLESWNFGGILAD